LQLQLGLLVHLLYLGLCLVRRHLLLELLRCQLELLLQRRLILLDVCLVGLFDLLLSSRNALRPAPRLFLPLPDKYLRLLQLCLGRRPLFPENLDFLRSPPGSGFRQFGVLL